MLEKPNLQDDRIIASLQDAYEMKITQIVFLPLGADRHAAVYRLVTDDKTPYFLKLKGGIFDENSVALPKCLSDQGIGHIISPLETRKGQLWANLDAFRLIVYPFVDGHNGYEVGLKDEQWADFGTALRSIHSAEMPPAISRRIRQESFSPQWREAVRSFLGQAENSAYDEPVAAALAAFLTVRRDEILALVERADQLARVLQARVQEFVLCHSDLHAGNILIDAEDAFYIVDWDEPILAPKERDLMFVGGGLMGGKRKPQEEESLFYRGYGQTPINHMALVYYRYERIIQDIAVECEQILATEDGGEDREQTFRYLTSNFLPNNTIEIAYQSDRRLSEG